MKLYRNFSMDELRQKSGEELDHLAARVVLGLRHGGARWWKDELDGTERSKTEWRKDNWHPTQDRNQSGELLDAMRREKEVEFEVCFRAYPRVVVFVPNGQPCNVEGSDARSETIAAIWAAQITND